MTRTTRALKWTVESMAANYYYIDVLTFYRHGLLADPWVSFVPILRWPGRHQNPRLMTFDTDRVERPTRPPANQSRVDDRDLAIHNYHYVDCGPVKARIIPLKAG
jgi:hypothetical protein